MPERLRIAWFSPLNFGDQPSSSVSAYISDLLLPLLRQRFDIDLYCDSFQVYRDFPTFHYLSAFSKQQEQPYDIIFYQLEDHPLARYLRIQIGLLPGIIWYHDLHFGDFGPEPVLSSSWREVLSLFNSARWEQAAAAWPKLFSKRDTSDLLGRREAAFAILALFSEPFAQKEYQDQISLRIAQGSERIKRDSFYLPYPVDFNDIAAGVRGADQILIGYCAPPTLEYRSHKFLQALAVNKERFELLWLVEAQEEGRAAKLLAEFEIERVQLLTGRCPRRWSELVGQCDLAVHTHYSMHGQPGVYLAVSLAAGLPTLVTRFRSSEHLLQDQLFVVEAGKNEAWQIERFLRLFSERPRPSGQKVRAWARELFDHKLVAEQLGLLFTQHASYCRSVLGRFSAFQAQAQLELFKMVRACLSGGSADQAEMASRDFAYQQLIEPVFRELRWIQ